MFKGQRTPEERNQFYRELAIKRGEARGIHINSLVHKETGTFKGYQLTTKAGKVFPLTDIQTYEQIKDQYHDDT